MDFDQGLKSFSYNKDFHFVTNEAFIETDSHKLIMTHFILNID